MALKRRRPFVYSKSKPLALNTKAQTGMRHSIPAKLQRPRDGSEAESEESGSPEAIRTINPDSDNGRRELATEHD